MNHLDDFILTPNLFKWEGHSEIDKYALSVYEKHFPESEALGDITTIRNTKGLPEKIDLVTFGFPCQDISVAGKRGGIEAARSGLFTKAMRIIRSKKPSYIIFENVKGLFSSDEGRALPFILRTLTRAGYDCQWQLLNTRWFLPQNRERIYLVGHLRGQPRPQVFPIGETDSRIIKGPADTATVRTLTAGGHSGGHHSGMTIIKGPKDVLGTIRTGGRGSKTKKHCWDLIQVPRGFNKGGIKDECGTITKNAFEHNNFVVERAPIKFPGRNGKKVDGDYAFTIDSMNTGGVKVGTDIRRLTPVECERLQGFTDNWTLNSINGEISDSQRYKMMGNAVSVPVVKAVVLNLLASGAKIETYLDLFSGAGGFRLGIEEAINEYNRIGQ